MPEDDAPFLADPPAADDGSEAELEDLATLDVDATVEEVMTAVHWIEDRTPGLGTDPQPVPAAAIAAGPVKAVRRRSPVVRTPPT